MAEEKQEHTESKVKPYDVVTMVCTKCKEAGLYISGKRGRCSFCGEYLPVVELIEED